MRRLWLVAVGLASSCQSQTFDFPEGDLAVDVLRPVYGSFANGRDHRVAGTVSARNAVVRVDGRRANVGGDGIFSVTLADDRPVRNVDVEAFLPSASTRARVPVFGGYDPASTWPGGATLRITERGLGGFGKQLAALVDDLGWEQTVLGLVPTISTGGFSLAPGLIRHAPTEVQLIPSDDGVSVDLVVPNLLIRIEASVTVGGEVIDLPIDVRFGEVRIGAQAAISVDAAGALVLDLTGATVSTADPELSLGPLDGAVLDQVLGALAGLLTGLGGTLLDAVIGGIPPLPLLNLPSIDSDLLGIPLSLQVSAIGTDPAGVTVALGMDGDGQPVRMRPPAMTEALPRADLLIALPDGALQPLVQSELLDLVDQDLQLPGLFAGVISATLGALPGGGFLPEVGAWCVRVTPGDARLVRLRDSRSVLATVYLPDMRANFTYATPGSTQCTQPWLDTTLAAQIDLTVAGGTAIGIDLRVPDGYVNAYEAPGDIDGASVIAGLGGLLDTLVGLVGGSLGLDLADVLGDDALGLPVDGLALRLIGNTPMRDVLGEPVPSTQVISLQLFD